MANEVCGRETEVYSRISGYYRPIKNWNEGKAQEFKDRKEYTQEQAVEGEALGSVKDTTDEKQTPIAQQDQGTVDIDLDGLVLFTTKTCPNCKAAKMFMDKLGLSYTTLFSDENTSLIDALGLRSAPTLVNFKEGSAKDIIAGLPGIRRYVADLPSEGEDKDCESCKF
jgi:ribonucleoside-triphosphate reductase